MSDYFDLFERELRDAAQRNAHLPWYLRIRSRRSRALVAALACLVVAGPALAAAGVFQAGTPVAPDVPPTPHANTGVAIPSSVRVLALRVSDPSGGPAWGLRFERTTRNLVCVQLGRVDFDMVGALGIDGAFHDDGRFHPFSNNYQDDLGCAVADAHGHAFVSDELLSIPTSAIEQSCYARLKTSWAVGSAEHDGPVCPPGSMREIYYGMLGPDALSITYPDAAGKLITRPTAGPDGAFLVVRGTGRACATSTISLGGHRLHASQCGGLLVGTHLAWGLIRRVTYRGGRTCVLPQAPALRAVCPLVGYAAPTTPLVTNTQVASPVTIHDEGVQYFCLSGKRRLTLCGAAPPLASRRAGPPERVLDVSFIARVAITNANSAYEITMHAPAGCGGVTSVGPTVVDLRAGQRVNQPEYVLGTCAGTIRGTVTYNTTRGPNQQQPGLNDFGRGALVGRFAITLPQPNQS